MPRRVLVKWLLLLGCLFGNGLLYASVNSALTDLANNTAFRIGDYNCTDSDYISCRTITDYSGFTYNPVAEQMLMFGGGHSASFRDDVDVFDFGSLTWAPAYTPTSCSAMTESNWDLTGNPDGDGKWISTGHPSSRHTYDLLAVTTNGSELLLLRPGDGPGGQCVRFATYGGRVGHYNVSSRTWSFGEKIPWGGYSSAEMDPVSGNAIIFDGQNRRIYTYNPTTRTATVALEIGGNADYGIGGNLVYFPPNDKFYYFRSNASATQVWEVTLDRNTWSNTQVVEVTGMTGTPSSRETGYAYDSVNHLIGGGVRDGLFYAFDPLTKVWNTVTMNTAPAAGASVGTVAFHALDYDPVNNVYLFITDYDSGFDVWAYRYAQAGNIVRVGPTRTLTTPSAAAAVVSDGDIVEIDAGTYNNDYAIWTANNLTLRAVGGKAHLHSSGTIPNGKGIWIIQGNNVIVDNIEFSGAVVNDQNGAGIRQEGGNLTVRNAYFHDNENGILSDPNPSAEILVESSEFDHNGLGDPGFTHNLYIDKVAKFTLRYSYSHHAVLGHTVKSRAYENHILYNRLMDEASGNSSYLVDLPDGGVSYLIGNVIQQGENADNATLVSYAAESTSNPGQAFYAVNNTLVNERSNGGTFFQIHGTPTQLITNNLMVGSGTAPGGTGTNLVTTDTAYLNSIAGYDYHLTANALAAIDAGSDPGSANSVSLTPVWEYVHALGHTARAQNGALDLGAYEYTGAAPAPVPVISAFTASPSTVVGGSVSALSWSTSNATSCVASGAWSGSQNTTGTNVTVGPLSATSTFTLTCTGSGGSVSQAVTVTVTSGGSNPPDMTDSDGDGMADSWELAYFGNLDRDGSGNWDGDAYTDAEEYLMSTDPTDDTTTDEVVNVTVDSTSSQAQSGLFATFGQVFKRGDVPQGFTLGARLADDTEIPLQVDVKATHGDHSLRHAVLTVQLPALSGNGAVSLTLFRTRTPLGGTAVALSNLLSGTFDATLDITTHEGSAVPYRLSVASVLADAVASSTVETWLSGPLVSEWIVTAPLARVSDSAEHPHLSAQFHVRAFAGLSRVRVSLVVENDWAYEAGPHNIVYDVGVTLEGAQAYARTGLEHFAQARWRKTFWWGGEPAIHVRHDSGYLMASLALPNYDRSLTVSEATLAAMEDAWNDDMTDAGLWGSTLIHIYEPMAPGLVNEYMPTTGGREDIGPLPGWAVRYLLSMDRRAKTSTLGTGDTAGSWPIHYRDKATGLPVSLDDYDHMTLLGNYADTWSEARGVYDAFPDCSGSCDTPYSPDSAHQPSLAYLPYLVTGDSFYLEELQFWANWNMLRQNPGYRAYGAGLLHSNQVRAQAWSLRTLAEAAFITPDAHPLKNYFVARTENNIAWYNEYYDTDGTHGTSTGNNLGVLTSSALDYNGGRGVGSWQDDFFTWVSGHVTELGFSSAKPLLDWKAQFPVGRITGAGYCWIQAAPYYLNIRDSSVAPVYADFGALYDANAHAATVGLSCGGSAMATALRLSVGQMMGDNVDATLGYPANMQPALAASADSGIAYAQQAWSTFDGRTNPPDYNALPVWAVVPRSSAAPAALAIALNASASVSTGGRATLTWTVTGASVCSASGAWEGTKASAGSEQSDPLIADATFTLSCSGSGGSASRSVTVAVDDPPSSTPPPVPGGGGGGGGSSASGDSSGGGAIDLAWLLLLVLMWFGVSREGASMPRRRLG